MLENVYKEKKIKEIRKIDFNNWDLFGIISLRIRVKLDAYKFLSQLSRNLLQKSETEVNFLK